MALLHTVFSSVESTDLAPHFSLLMAQILRGLAHTNMRIKQFALSVAKIVMLFFPELCKNSSDLFDTYLTIISGQRRIPDKQV